MKTILAITLLSIILVNSSSYATSEAECIYPKSIEVKNDYNAIEETIRVHRKGYDFEKYLMPNEQKTRSRITFKIKVKNRINDSVEKKLSEAYSDDSSLDSITNSLKNIFALPVKVPGYIFSAGSLYSSALGTQIIYNISREDNEPKADFYEAGDYIEDSSFGDFIYYILDKADEMGSFIGGLIISPVGIPEAIRANNQADESAIQNFLAENLGVPMCKEELPPNEAN